MKKILVADVPQMDARYQAAAAGWELAFARTTTQACHALASSPPDMPTACCGCGASRPASS